LGETPQLRYRAKRRRVPRKIKKRILRRGHNHQKVPEVPLPQPRSKNGAMEGKVPPQRDLTTHNCWETYRGGGEGGGWWVTFKASSSKVMRGGGVDKGVITTLGPHFQADNGKEPELL